MPPPYLSRLPNLRLVCLRRRLLARDRPVLSSATVISLATIVVAGLSILPDLGGPFERLVGPV